MITVYLAGPIADCTDEEVHGWRDEIKETFAAEVSSGAIKFLDPSARDYRGRETQFAEDIVVQDLDEIDECDVLFANYWKTGTGTSMEIAYMYWMREAPVVVVVPEGKFVSPWLTYHGTVVRSLEEAVIKLREYLR